MYTSWIHQSQEGVEGAVHRCLIIQNVATLRSWCPFGDWNNPIKQGLMLIIIVNNNAWQVVSEAFDRLIVGIVKDSKITSTYTGYIL